MHSTTRASTTTWRATPRSEVEDDVNADDRHQEMLQLLGEQGTLSISELAVRYEVSDMTIRRDLNQLAAQGLLVRTRGGAAASSSGSFEPPFALRERTRTAAKAEIAAAAAREIVEGQTVLLDGGTTGLAIADALAGRNLTVCTLNVRIAERLATDSSMRVMIPGGTIRPGEFSLVGPEAEAMLSRFRFDVYLMTASGVSVDAGVTEWNADDAAVKRAALAASRRTVLVADAGKFGAEAFVRVCPLSQVDMLVTDAGLAAADRKQVAATGTELVVA
jgi:DeoR/GlpR family transcriptional regulator of sugar metabolism